MLGGVNPKQMQAMMKKMGISQNEIPAKRVIIEKNDGENIIIENPNIIKIKMQGQTSFQITGEETLESTIPKITQEDINLVMEKTGCSEQDAKKTLEKTNDLTLAIMELSD